MTIDSKTLVLLQNATANVTGEWRKWTGVGPGTIQIDGTFDTCTVTIQGSLDGGETVTDISADTSAAFDPFAMGRGLVRAVLSSVGAGTDINVYLSPQETV